MKQYVCDRCGATIPIYTEDNHILFYDEDVRDTHVQYQRNNKYNECDLCDDCLEYLHNMTQAFMKNYELFFK